MAEIWDTHNIRPSGSDNVPFGRPDVMIYIPKLWYARNQIQIVQEAELDVCSREATFQCVIPSDEDVDQLCVSVMRRDYLDPPQKLSEVIQLYRHLRNEILLLIIICKPLPRLLISTRVL